jgi:hypothetical protein
MLRTRRTVVGVRRSDGKTIWKRDRRRVHSAISFAAFVALSSLSGALRCLFGWVG